MHLLFLTRVLCPYRFACQMSAGSTLENEENLNSGHYISLKYMPWIWQLKSRIPLHHQGVDFLALNQWNRERIQPVIPSLRLEETSAAHSDWSHQSSDPHRCQPGCLGQCPSTALQKSECIMYMFLDPASCQHHSDWTPNTSHYRYNLRQG